MNEEAGYMMVDGKLCWNVVLEGGRGKRGEGRERRAENFVPEGMGYAGKAT